jgi:ribosomal protein S18 acetylase RimI-like enzyme
MSGDPITRVAAIEDAGALARIMYDFNTEFDEEIDDPEVLEARYRRQLEACTVAALLAGDGPDGFAQLRYREQVYSDAPCAYLEELYVRPSRRGHGLGRALLGAAMDEARRHGADFMELGTSEDDEAARGLYESMGFTNREGRPDGPVMLYYERDL